MEDAKSAMAIVSILGAAAGIYYVSIVNPENNYFVFMAIFALIGVAVANVVLVAVNEVYRWLKMNYLDTGKAEPAQPS